MFDKDKFKSFLKAQIGKPYKFGAECPENKELNQDVWDCSELIEAAFRVVGIKFVDGSSNQYGKCRMLKDGEGPDIGCLGFFRRPDGTIHHVGAWFDNDNVCEARGEPYNRVLFRPVAKWEAWKEFTGWMKPRILDV